MKSGKVKSFDDKLQHLGAMSHFSGSHGIPGGRKLTVRICRPKNLKSDKSTQTDYRESESQTVPWTPEVVFHHRGREQHLTQEWLAIGENVPPNLEKIVLIERARQKRAWENSVPRSVSKKKEFCRLSCVAAIAMNEANFRETLMEIKHKERLTLSKEKLKISRDEMLLGLKSRVEKRRQENSAAVSHRLKYWDHQLKRRLRKLTVSTTKLREKFKKDRLDIFIMKDLENWPHLYKFDNISIMEKFNREGATRYLAEFRDIELLEKQIAMSLPQEFHISKKPKSSYFCSKIVRNAEKKIEPLRLDMKDKELKTGIENHLPRLNLRRRIADSYAGISESKIQELDRLENLYQSSLFLKKIVKGRAIQTRLFSALVQFKTRKSE